MPKVHSMMHVGGLDVKLGLRLMRKSWGLTLAGGLAMAVTIALGTSIFTLWKTATSTRLPLPDGDRIVALQTFNPATQRIYRDSSLQDLQRWRDNVRSISEIGAMRLVPRTITTPDRGAGRITVAEMTPSAFRVAGVPALLGRPLLDDDDRGAANVVVIGFTVWQGGFSADPGVIGRRLRLDEVDYTVVGVMPETFAFPVSQRVWTPLRTSASDYPAGKIPEVFVFGRLASGFTRQSAEAEVAALGLTQQTTSSRESRRARVVPYVTGWFSLDESSRWAGTMIVLLAALLLLPPCANIAILVYARAVTRREEFAMRYALGASRGRIVAQMFIEVLVLAAAAGTIGFFFATQFSFAQRLSDAVLPTMGAGNVPFWFDFRPSLSVALCLAGLVLFSAALAGVIPAMRVTRRWRRAGIHALAERGDKAGLGRTWTALLAIQVAIAVAVLPVGTQVVWGIVKPSLTRPGLDVDRFLTGRLVMEGDAARSGARLSELLRRLTGEAGVSGVTVSAEPLMDEPQGKVQIGGGGTSGYLRVAFNEVDRAFFDVFGARFRMGRAFDANDFGPAQSQAIVVNRTFAMEVAGADNVLGRRVHYVTPEDADVTRDAGRWFEIIGVVENFPADDDQATIYHPLPAAAPARQLTITLRLERGTQLGGARLRELTGAVDPLVRIVRLQSLAESDRDGGSVRSTLGFMVGSVMLIVVLFALVGMYTLMAFIVAQRWREVGVRCALGASPRRLVTDIFGRSLIPLLLGAAAGCPLAILIDASIDVADIGGSIIPGAVPGTAVVMMLAGVAALAGPVRRAIRINPMDALRST